MSVQEDGEGLGVGSEDQLTSAVERLESALTRSGAPSGLDMSQASQGRCNVLAISGGTLPNSGGYHQLLSYIGSCLYSLYMPLISLSVIVGITMRLQ